METKVCNSALGWVNIPHNRSIHKLWIAGALLAASFSPRAFAADATIVISATGQTGGSNGVVVSFSDSTGRNYTETAIVGPFSSPASIASELGGMFSRDYNAYGLCAHSSGSTVYFHLNGTALLDNPTISDASLAYSATPVSWGGILYAVAGNGASGFSGDGGLAIDAALGGADYVARDSAGNLYIADGSNNRVRKVAAATGIISTIAGNGSEGYCGVPGPALSACLEYPFSLAVDSVGNVYIAGLEGSFEVNSSGYMSVMNIPARAMATDLAGNLYLATNEVTKVAAGTGTVTIVAGGGNGCAGQTDAVGDGCPATSGVFRANGIAVDSLGNIYIADAGNNLIRKVSASTGIITTIAGGGTLSSQDPDYPGDGGPATSAELGIGGSGNFVIGMAADAAGNLYFDDELNYRTREVIASTGMITTVVGSGASNFSNGIAATNVLFGGSGLALDSANDLYMGFGAYVVAMASTKITPELTWLQPNTITYGTALSGIQLNASSGGLPGTFSYSVQPGTILPTGVYILSVTFTPNDSTDYNSATAAVPLIVSQVTPTVTWATPASIVSGTSLSSTQLNASASVPGTFAYSPVAGTILPIGPHTLSVTFTPNDTTDYAPVTASAEITVDSAGSIFDTGIVTLTVNGGSAASTSYGRGATPSSIAEGLAAGVKSGAPVTVKAVDDAVYIEATQGGSASDYSYSIQTTTWDNTDFPEQASFAYPPITGQLEGGASQNSSTTTVYNYSANYDGNSNVINYNDSVMGAWNFYYDSLNRLSNSQNVGTTSTSTSYAGMYGCWSYDSFGNRTSEATSTTTCNNNPPLTTWSAFNANNQLVNTSQAIAGVGTDSSGNVTNDGQHQYLYDAEGRICAVYTSVYGIGAFMTGYIYDAEGRRVSKGSITSFSCDPAISGFTTTNEYILDASGQQMTEEGVDANNTIAWQHTNVWAGSSLLATYDSNGLHFYLDDPLGSRRVQTDYAGALEQSCLNLPYGDAESCSPLPTEHLFTGKERDTESGNDYFGARYYASSMGRFMSPDWSAHEEPVPYAKLDNPQSLNLYSYVLNNPLRSTDPDGHGCWSSWSSMGQCLSNLSNYGHAVTNADLNGALASDAQNALKTLNAAGVQIGGVPAAQALQGKSNKDIVDALAGAQSALASGTMGSVALNFDTSQLQHEFSHAGDFGINGNWNKQAGQDFQQALEDIVKNPSTKESTITFRGEAGYKAYLDPQSGKAVIFKPNGDFHAAWSLSADQVRAMVVNGKL